MLPLFSSLSGIALPNVSAAPWRIASLRREILY